VTTYEIKIVILMKKTAILLASFFITINTIVNGQLTHRPDSIQAFEKAKYLKEDLTVFLDKNVSYPNEAVVNNIEGDVVLSLIINKTGKSDSLIILTSPHLSLSTSSIIAFNRADEAWSPSKINGQPIDKKYKIIFRYRMPNSSFMPDYKNKVAEFCKKKKYDKALDVLEKAIGDNPYDFELFESRAGIKGIIGDSEGSGLDLKTSDNLKNEIMAVVNVYNRRPESPRTLTIIRTEIKAVEVHR
jgi:tetratricopeptide (TPR) repeat protein